MTEAKLADGLLVISLKREIPEALKPRKIEIKSADNGQLIESAAA